MAEYIAAQASVLLVPSTDGFIKKLQEKLETDLEKYRPEVTVKPVLDKKALAEVAAEIESAKGLDKDKAKIRLGITLDKSSLASSAAEIETLKKAIGADSVNIKVKTDQVDSARKGLSNLDKELSGLSSQATKGILFRVAFVGLPVALAGIASLNTAIVELSQSALLIPGAVAGAVAVFATFATGISGVKAAIQAANKEQENAVTVAQKYADANRTVTESQNSLNRAYKDAKRNLEDLYAQMRDAPLDVAEAQIKLDEARIEAAKKWGKTGLQQQEDTLSLMRAQNALSDAQRKGTRVAQDFNDANSKGIQGSDQVISATDRLQKAIDNLNNTMSQDAFSKAMSKLAPQAQDFVNQVKAMGTQWDAFKQEVQGHLFAGLADETKKLGTLLPSVQGGFDRIADSLNNNLKTAVDALTSGGSKSLLDQILGNTANAQKVLSGAINPLVHGFETLAATGSKALPRLAESFDKLAGRFDNFISKAAADGSLDKWINEGLTAVGQLGEAFINAGKIMASFSDLFTAAGGKGLTALLKDATDHLVTFLNSASGKAEVKQFFTDVLTAVKGWGPILKDLPGLFLNIVSASETIGSVVLPVLRLIGSVLSSTNPIVSGMVTAFLAWRTFHPIITATSNLVGSFRDKVIAATTVVDEGGGTSKKSLRGALSGLAGFLKSAGFTAAIAAGIYGIDKLSAAHDRATEAAGRQQQKLEALKNTIDATTGNATPQTIADTAAHFQNYPLPSGKKVNINSDAAGLGINPSDAVSAAADPTQQTKKDTILKQLDSQTQSKIEASDEYKRSKAFWDAAGIDSHTLALATNGDPASVKRVQDAMKTPFDKLPFGGGEAVRGLVHGVIDPLLPASATPGVAPTLQDFSNIAGASASVGVAVRDTSKGLQPDAQDKANSSDVASGAPKGWQLNPNSPFASYGPDPHAHRDPDGKGEITLNNAPNPIPDSWKANGWDASSPVNGRVTVTIPKAAADQYLSKVPGFARGGMFSGTGSGTSDSNLAKVSNGEFISQASSVQKYGPGLYQALNSGAIDPGMLPGFDEGGLANIPLAPPPTPTPTPTPGGGLGPLLVPGPGDVTPPAGGLPGPLGQLPPNPAPGAGLTPSPKATQIPGIGDLPIQHGGGQAAGPGGPILPSPSGGGILPGALPGLAKDPSLTLPSETPPPAPTLSQDIHGLPDISSPGSAPSGPANSQDYPGGPPLPNFTPPGAVAKDFTPPPIDMPAPPAGPPGAGDLANGLPPALQPMNFLSQIGHILIGALLGAFGINSGPIFSLIEQLFGGQGSLLNQVTGKADPNVAGILSAQPGRNQQYDPGQVNNLPGASGPPPGVGGPTSSPGAAPSGNVKGGRVTLPDGTQIDIGENPLSKARIPLGGSTTDAVKRAGLAPLYKPGTAFNYGAQAPVDAGVPPAIFQIAKAFGLQASTYPDGGTLHQAGFAFDFRPDGVASGSPEGQARMDRFSQFVTDNLGDQTLELIHRDINTQQHWGIAGAQAVDQPGSKYQNYYGAGDQGYGGHGDHVHWATDIAPIVQQFAPWFAPGASGAAPGGGPQGAIGAPAAPSGFKPGGGNSLAPALQARGFSPQQIRLIQGFSQVEGNNPAGNPTLGFTDAQLGGASDLPSHADALAQQFKARASVAGPFPEAGTDQQRAQWIARVVGQAGLQSDWQGNGQPPDYVQRVTKAMQGFATGGMLNGAGSGTSDSMLARVSNGEFITKASSVAKYGPELFHALNQGAIDPGMLPGFASGGQVSNTDDLKKLLQDSQDAQRLQSSGGPLNQDVSAQQELPSPDTAAQHIQDQPNQTSIAQKLNPPQAQGPGQLQASLPGMGDGTSPDMSGPSSGPQPAGPPVTDTAPQPGASAPSGASMTPDPRSTPGPTIPNAQQNHNIPWLDQAVKEGINYAGQIGATALGMAGGAASSSGFAPGASAATAIAGMAVSQGAQVLANDASAALNVISSLGVGTLTPGTTAGAYGSPLLPQQQDASLSGPRVVNNYGDIHTASYDQFYQGQQRREEQQMAPYVTAMS